MKTAIIYFSQTGNTKKVAEAICSGIKEVSGQCDLLKLLRANEFNVENLPNYDLIGLGCPTFGYEDTFNVTLLARRMGACRGKHSFVFTTSAGHPGNALPSMADKLAAKGLVVIGGFSCDGRAITPIDLPSPWYTDGHPDETDLKDAANFGKEMVERSTRISRGETGLAPDFEWLDDEFYYSCRGHYVPRSEGFAIEMTLDREKCIYPRCRLCMDNCPAGAIDLSVETIKFRKGCTSCYFCETLCPTSAIEFVPNSLEEHGRRRDRHFYGAFGYPAFFEKAQTGLIGNRSTLLRILPEKDKVSKPHDPSYRVNPRRPRFKITPS